MAAYNWPANLTPQTVSWGIQKAAIQSRSPMAGSVESIEFPGQFWKCSLTLPERKIVPGSAAASFFERLAGGAECVLVPYWPRLVPLGSMRGSPVTVAIATRGDLLLQVGTPGSLMAGDMIGCGGQLFRVFADCTSTGAVLTVPLVNRVRATIATGSVVVWASPTAQCCMPASSFNSVFAPGRQQGIAVDLEEV